MNGQRKKAGAIALLAAGAVAGGVLASTLSATAASTPKPQATSGSQPGVPGPADAQGPNGAQRPGGGHGPGGAQPMRSDEKLVTGSDLTTLTAAAQKAVPGATIVRVETDAGDGVYEAHMKKADGSLVTVKFDKNLKVIRVEQGMGQGDPHGAGHGGPGGPPPAGTASPGTTTG